MGQGRRRPRVLIIDDEPVLAEALREALSEHDVTCVRGGRAGLERLEHGEFDAVLCDLQLPDASPEQFCTLVAQRWPERREQLVFMTGGVVDPALARMVARTGARVLLKPFEVAEVVAVVASLSQGGDAGVRR